MAKSTISAENTPNAVQIINGESVDVTRGEVITAENAPLFKYLEGHPRQYRFDAKESVFNINGTDKIGRTLTFQPVAWRIFTDNILNMGTKNWVEIFFIDEKNCVSAVLFHGYSVDNIFRLIEPLYYDDMSLADVIITAVAEKKENTKVQPKGVYYIATFSYKIGDATTTNELKQFARTARIFRQETLTNIANVKTSHGYFNPFTNGDTPDELPEGSTPYLLPQGDLKPDAPTAEKQPA
jgi:hypothetical protein